MWSNIINKFLMLAIPKGGCTADLYKNELSQNKLGLFRKKKLNKVSRSRYLLKWIGNRKMNLSIRSKRTYYIL